ncbi:MAG: flagellar export chaperone FliS [Verrucomicrobia bacterium]|nr:flagellar export chaperone FliS [Verrucomicrobiota bacterium]
MTATPHQLIGLLYDGLIRFLRTAQDAFSEPDPLKRMETVHNSIIRAQNIITELNNSLNMEKGGEVAQRLRGLYEFFYSSLTQVNLTKNPATDATTIFRITRLVMEIRDAWNQIAPVEQGQSPQTGGTVSTAGQIQFGRT